MPYKRPCATRVQAGRPWADEVPWAWLDTNGDHIEFRDVDEAALTEFTAALGQGGLGTRVAVPQ